MTTNELSEKNVSSSERVLNGSEVFGFRTEVEPRTVRVRQSEIDEQTELRSVYAFVNTDTVRVATADGGRESVDSRANENAGRSRDGIVEAKEDVEYIQRTGVS
jgi:hypothetical protein